MSSDFKAALEHNVEVLPVLPQVVSRVLLLDPKSETYFDDVVRLIESEPNYAVRLVAAANSVATRGVTPVVRIRDAVVRLGAREVSSLVLSMAVVRVFAPRNDWERGLWTHAVEVASVARALAKLHGNELDPERAYLLGLLHDVGRFIMFNVSPDALREVDEATWDSPEALGDAERRVCGMDHATLGAEICAKWQVPQHITDFVRVHHAPDVESKLPPPDGKIAHLIQVGDMAAFSSVSTRHNLVPLRDMRPADADAYLRKVLPEWFPRTATLRDNILTAMRQAQVTLRQLGLAPEAKAAH